MRVILYKYLCIAFSLIILAILTSQNIYAGDLAASELRKRADILKEKINLCKQDIANGAQECFVMVNWENNRKVTMVEAENLASKYIKEAQQIDEACDSKILPSWNPEELSNPEAYAIAVSLDKYKVPPLPIPAKEVSINWKELAFDDPWIAKLLDGGFILYDIFGKIGTSTIAGKVTLIAGKTFIAGEEGALVFLTKKNEIYEKAAKYLKDSTTSKQFVNLVRELKETGNISTVANPDMIKAVKAITDPSLGSNDTAIAWDAMLSREAVAAMAQKAALELSMLGISEGATALLHQTNLPGRKATYDCIRLDRNKALHKLKDIKDASDPAIFEFTRDITHANKQIENLYRAEIAGPNIFGFLGTQWPYKEKDK